MRARVATVVLLCCVTVAGAAWADETGGGREAARQHFRAGESKFRAGDYRGALVEFLAADAIVPSPILMHNAAVCHERLGQAGDAARRYREYLARRPDAPNRREVEVRIAALEGAQQPPDVLPSEEPGATSAPPSGPPDGDGLVVPRGVGEPPSVPPPRRPYDESFARRVPSRGAAEAPPPAGYGNENFAQPENPPPAAEGVGGQLSQRSDIPAPEQQAPEPMPQPEPRKEKPVYKQWWFWVFVGVGALILIDVASSGDKDRGDTPTARPVGLTVFSF